jgi:hypothetical protein
LNLKRITSHLIFILLLALTTFSEAQVSTNYFFNQSAAFNPAVLLQKKSSSSLAFDTSSGTGTYQQNQLEREKRTYTSANLLATHQTSDAGYQAVLTPSSEIKIDEVTQYSRAAATEKNMELNFAGARKWNESIAWGAGLGTRRNSFGSYTQATYLLTGGASYVVNSHFSVGLVGRLNQSSAPSEQARSWIDYAGGISAKAESMNWKLRLDYSNARSPRVYQKASSDQGAGYQRMWTENRYVAEAAYNLNFFDLALQAEFRNRNIRALEDGIEELESEEDLGAGMIFANEKLGFFVGQQKQTNKIYLHVTSQKSSYAKLFYSF